MQNVLFRMSGTPGQVRWPGRKIGQDNEGVYAEIGIGPERLAELRARGVV
jgi:crotonobetainyl-CoA:carnitine CoA-transferase CaiB-like acyl-CoA transferase